MLLTLIVWIGGIIFFAFVEAPALFTVLPTTKLAGDVVRASLIKVHWMGLVSGIVFLICSLLYNRAVKAQLKPFMLSHIFIVLMLALTMYSAFSIMPRMDQMRNYFWGQGDVHPGLQAEFNRLHEWSTRLEGGVLLLGMGVVFLTAKRFDSSK
jgi:hypothetical protein